MRPMGRLAALLAVAAIAAMPVAVLAASPASAETGVDVQDVCSATAGDGALRINLLVLLDTSGSLRTTDPNNLRSAGTSDALQVIEGLSLRYPDDADIEVALDTFDARYSRQEGWYPASEIYSRVGNSIGIIASDAGQYTDYGAALTGAWERFATRADDCNLLIWFTDGQHATAADEVGEQRELFELCSSPEMQSLRDHVWVGAVQLRDDDLQASRLRYLYGEEGPADASLSCINQLRGNIYDSFDGDRLNTVLRELIETAVGQTPQPSEGPMPGSERPSQSEFDEGRCTGGDGSPSRPCVVPFDLDHGMESFRAFVDLTLIGREIQNPEEVLAVVRAPDGTTSPSIGGDGDIKPREQTGQYLPVEPFGFFTRSNYPSDLQIVGHQVAEQLAGSRWTWQWEGRWELLFHGSNPSAQADARRAAAVVDVRTSPSPEVDSLAIDSMCSVSGFVVDYPTADYSDIELRLHVDAADGAPVYPTRQSLTEGLLVVAQDNRRFAIPGIFGELVSWDSTDQGGNGTNLREAVTQRGGVTLVAVLSQTFTYAGAPEPVVWSRDIGRLELSERQATHLLGLIDGGVADPLLCLPLGAGPWIAAGVVLGDPQHDWGGASVEVSAVAGELPATLSLVAEGVEFVEQDSETGAAALTGLEIDNAEWTCEVPAAAAGSSRFTCPEPITIEVSTEQPLRPAMQLRIPLTITESSGSAVGLLERLGYEPDSAGYGARSDALAGALSRERRAEMFAVDLGAMIDPNAVWRPSDFQMEAIDPPDVIDVKSILVSASPGRLPALADLESVLFVQEPDGASREAGSVEIRPWTCAIPGSESGGGRFPCAEPITVHVPPNRDVELSLVPTLCAIVEPGAVEELLERSGVPEGTSDFETLRRLISEAVERERACAEATTPVPPTPDPIWERFLPMLAVLVAAAAAARVLIAWRLRPWQPIGSPDYAVVPLDNVDTDSVSVPAPDPSQICMDLQQRKSATNIEGLSLRSRWLPLLRGGEPELRASSASGDCIGPDGHRRPRHGRAEAVIGTDLVRGWIVHDTGNDPRLIVWDLPFDDDDTRRARIIDAERDAVLAWERYRASVPVGGPTPGDSVADSAESDPTARHLTESDPALQDPFADDSSDRSGDNGPDLDDADPFGRDS